MIPRLTRLTATAVVLSIVAAFAWAAQYEKDGCVVAPCNPETYPCEEPSPACTDACPAACNPCNPCKAECGKKDECGNCCDGEDCRTPCGAEAASCDTGCCKKEATSCGNGCCKKAKACGSCAATAKGCGACCKAIAAVAKTCGACCKGDNGCRSKKEARACKSCCTSAASACGSCCASAAVSVADACCACCKSECACAKKESVKACCACCKAATVSVSDACCACCKGECACAKKETVKACCACCKTAAVSVAEGCCACCKGECPCSKKVTVSACSCCEDCKKAGSCACQKKAKPEEAKPPVAPVFTPTMVMPHLPGTPPMPYFHVPVVPPSPMVPQIQGGFDHTGYLGMPMTPVCPMACPNVGYTVPSACPMPQAVGLAYTTASATRQYEICVKLLDCKVGREDKVVVLPKVTVAEGQPGICTIGTQSGAGRMRVHVDRLDAGKVTLGIRLSKHHTSHEADGSVTLCQSCSAIRTVKLDDAVRLALCNSCEESECGKSGKWVEIVVKECSGKSAFVPPPPAACMPPCSMVPPMPCAPPCPMACGTPSACPAPPPCLSPPPMPEIVRCGAEAKCEQAGRVASIGSDGCVQLRDGDCTVRGTCVSLTVKGTTLTLRCDDMKGRKRMCVEADCDLEAVADTMSVEPDGRLMLEGEVKILCASPSSGMAERVEADSVVVELENGKMKSIQVLHDKP